MPQNTSRAFHVLSAIFFLNSIAWRGGKLLIALGALALGADAFTVGLLAAAYAFAPMLVSVHAGRITDRFGLQFPIMLGAAFIFLAAAVPAIHLNIITLFICPVFVGLGQLFLQVAVHNGVGSISLPETRSVNYARLQVVGSAAAFVGPLLIGISIDHFGINVGFGIVAIMALAIGLPAFAVSQHFDPPTPTIRAGGERATDLLSHPRLRRTLFTSAIAMCGLELFAFYLPIYGHSIGMSATTIGAVVATYASAAFLVRASLGILIRRLGEMKVLTISMFIGAVSFAIIPIFGNVPVLFVASVLLGLGLGVATPLTQSMAYANSPEGRTGEALGLRLFVNKGMQVAVPLAFGSLGAAFGVAPVFWANAVVLAVGGIITHRQAMSNLS